MASARYLVEGRVQGVGFRAATRGQAQALGLEGYARNLEDGRVDVCVHGEPAAIAALASWLAEGPPLARVTRVQRAEDVPVEDSVAAGQGFAIL